jgi:hypothetical protein
MSGTIPWDAPIYMAMKASITMPENQPTKISRYNKELLLSIRRWCVKITRSAKARNVSAQKLINH